MRGFAGDAHIGDICSPVGAQGWNINKQGPGVEPGSLVRRGSFLVEGSWLENAAGARVPGFSVWHTVGS